MPAIAEPAATSRQGRGGHEGARSRPRRAIQDLCGALLLATAIGGLSAAAPGGDGLNTRYEAVPDRPLLVEGTTRFKGTFDGPRGSDPVEAVYELAFVDRSFVPEGKKKRLTRRFVKMFATVNGDRRDLPFQGLQADYTVEGDDIEVHLADRRVLPDEYLDRLLQDHSSVGITAPFPRKAKVGKSYDIDVRSLALLLGSSGYDLDHAEGRFELASYQPANRECRFEGRVTLREESFIYDLPVTLTTRGTCTIITSLEERRLLSLSFKGEYELEASDYSVSGQGTVESEVTTTLGKKAEKALKRRLRFRTNIVRAYGLGLGMKLPSSYAPMPMEYPELAWVRTLDSHLGQAVITLEHIDFENSNPGFYLDKVEAVLRKDYPDLITRKSRCPIGKGRAYYIPKGTGSSSREVFQSEIYPLKEARGFLLIKLYGPPGAYQKAWKDFERAKASLGYLP